MGDAVAGGHQIDRARLDRREGAERIAMVDRAGEQIGDGGEVDVRVRPHVDALAGRQLRRAHLVEEDERADRRALAMGQGAMDLEPAEIVGGREQGLEEKVVAHGFSSAANADDNATDAFAHEVAERGVDHPLPLDARLARERRADRQRKGFRRRCNRRPDAPRCAGAERTATAPPAAPDRLRPPSRGSWPLYRRVGREGGGRRQGRLHGRVEGARANCAVPVAPRRGILGCRADGGAQFRRSRSMAICSLDHVREFNAKPIIISPA